MAQNIETKQYAWRDHSLHMLGRKVTGLIGFTYGKTTEKEHVHAAGDEAQTINSGNKTVQGEIVFLQSELEAFLRATDNAPEDVAFDLVHSYSANGVLITDTVYGAEVSDWAKSMAQNDKKMEITIPFLAMGINANV